eukprot:478647_1
MSNKSSAVVGEFNELKNKLQQNGWTVEPWLKFLRIIDKTFKQHNFVHSGIIGNTKIIKHYIGLFSPQLQEYKALCIFGELAKGSPLSVHGGLSFTLMDDVGSLCTTLSTKHFGITKSTEKIQFNKTIKTNRLYQICAKLIEQKEKTVKMKLTVCDKNNVVHVEAISIYRMGKRLPVTKSMLGML